MDAFICNILLYDISINENDQSNGRFNNNYENNKLNDKY
jgi:hypothetical protein